MKINSFVAIAILCILFVHSSPMKAAPDEDILGDWGMTATSAVYPKAEAAIGVYLTSVNDNVSGLVFFRGGVSSSCYSQHFLNEIPMTGTIDPGGNLALSGKAVNGTIISLHATVTRDSQLAGGTYSVVGGGCEKGDEGTLAGSKFAGLNGRYIGTMRSSSGGMTTDIVASFSQTAGPDSKGYMRLNGTGTFMGSPCFTSTTIWQTSVLGNSLEANFVPENSHSPRFYVDGIISPDGRTIAIRYQIIGGSCDKEHGDGILTLQ